MSDHVAETLVRDFMRLDFPQHGFAWQGGEPTLMGLDFYRRGWGGDFRRPSYFCAAYRRFFDHTREGLQLLAEQWRQRGPSQ